MDTLYSPDYLLRSYAWAVLKANTDMRESQYGGLIPIVPISEAPEISDYGKPYLVYGYITSPSIGVHARRRGSITFAVYTPDFRKLTRMLTILEEAFGRDDASAADINGFTSTIPQFVGIRFGTVGVGLVEGGTPEQTEGGDQSGLINIRFEYYVDYAVKTKPADLMV